MKRKKLQKLLQWALALTLIVTPAILLARVQLGDIAKTAFTFRPQALTATTAGTAVDRLNYLSILATLDVGAVSGTTPTLDCTVQESDTSAGAYTNITGATFTQVVAANQRQDLKVDLLGKKRFIRSNCTVGGTTPSFTMSLIFVLGEPGVSPLP